MPTPEASWESTWVRFAVPRLNRADDGLRLACARFCEAEEMTVGQLAIRAGLDPRQGWGWLAGRHQIYSGALCSILDAADARIVFRTDGARLLNADQAAPIRHRA